ncbi:cilia- and flagella-associated protein 299 isoform X3 [Fukomys damarensis]|uniref:cilia- and flagella-associated protein 299 isoform X3 n=1 Tax=Fukomys damarensis TaxID=885580 RepID=UPI00053F9607|nr:cilia- and flagella-associated protein 299 isoform X3 [Fukomys damarensis]
MDQDEGRTSVDNIVTQFNTYEDFLDSQITTVDLYYLGDESLARQLVELGYRGTGEILKREDFEARKAAIEITRLAKRTQKKTLASAGKDLQDNFLKALAMREEDNRSGKVSSVIFIRDKNSYGQEVSGYIDYADRLKTEDFEVYFSGKKRLLPRPTDLRFTQVTTLPEPLSRQTSTYKLSFLTTSPEGRLKHQHPRWLPYCLLILAKFCS